LFRVSGASSLYFSTFRLLLRSRQTDRRFPNINIFFSSQVAESFSVTSG
jgi:hypothetical protein